MTIESLPTLKFSTWRRYGGGSMVTVRLSIEWSRARIPVSASELGAWASSFTPHSLPVAVSFG